MVAVLKRFGKQSDGSQEPDGLFGLGYLASKLGHMSCQSNVWAVGQWTSTAGLFTSLFTIANLMNIGPNKHHWTMQKPKLCVYAHVCLVVVWLCVWLQKCSFCRWPLDDLMRQRCILHQHHHNLASTWTGVKEVNKTTWDFFPMSWINSA